VRAHGWDRAFWLVRDEGPLEGAIAVQWLARFHEDELGDDLHATRLPVHVHRGKFRLHRVVNDALAEVDLVDSPRAYLDAFVAKARSRGVAKGKRWAERIDVDRDRPLNIEGAAFTEEGLLLLGLRTPTTADGRALVVGLAGVPEWFDGGDPPRAVGVWWLDGPGGPDAPVGIRALRARPDGRFDAVVGSLDATGKDSLLLEHHPEGGIATSEHVRFALPPCSGPVPAQTMSRQTDQQRIEGIALDPDGNTLLVVDDDHHVHLRVYDAG
jgi:hypothetical protein